MNRYAMSMMSSTIHNLEILKRIVSLDVVRRVVFPARLPLSEEPDDTMLLSTPENFRVSLLPSQAFVHSTVLLPLDGENGIEFRAHVNLAEFPFSSSVVNLMFGAEHFESGIITYDDIKEFFNQLIPVFKVEHGSLYDSKTIRIGDLKYFFDAPKRHQYPAEIAWFNYFGPQLVEFLGKERFERISEYAERYELHGGIMLILQKEAFDFNDLSHRHCQRRAEKEFGFSELT